MKGITFPFSSRDSFPNICTLSALFLQKSNKENVVLSFDISVYNSIPLSWAILSNDTFKGAFTS